jgi:hypothetical protein
VRCVLEVVELLSRAFAKELFIGHQSGGEVDILAVDTDYERIVMLDLKWGNIDHLTRKRWIPILIATLGTGRHSLIECILGIKLLRKRDTYLFERTVLL